MLEMDLDRCIGLMEVTIKDNGQMVFKMAMDKHIYQIKGIKKEYFKIMLLSKSYNKDCLFVD